MLAGGMHPSLVSGLSDIFAWSIDFFGLQKGDSFKVIYEEMSIDDKPLGVGKIYGAQFSGSGVINICNTLYSGWQGKLFRRRGQFAPQGIFKGSSCSIPVFPHAFREAGCILSSGSAGHITESIMQLRSERRLWPSETDALQKPVIESGSGRVVRIVHNSVYSTAYLHLSRFGAGITSGAFVKQGDISRLCRKQRPFNRSSPRFQILYGWFACRSAEG